MGKRQSKEFRKRLEIKERNKNNWKNKVKESSVKVEVVQLEKVQEEAQEIVVKKPVTMYVKVNKDEQQIIKPIVIKNEKAQFGNKIQNVFARKDAQLAEQKRKDEYLKAAYKKMQEGQEDFLR